MTLPFEYKHDLAAPNIQGVTNARQQIPELIKESNDTILKLDQLKPSGKFNKWEQSTLNLVAPGYFDNVLKPQHSSPSK